MVVVASKFEDVPKRKRIYNPERAGMVTPDGEWVTTSFTDAVKAAGGVIKDFGAMIHDIRPGSIPPVRKLHIHKNQDTIFLVLTGRLVVNVEGTEYELGAKSFLWIPRGIKHEFTKAIEHTQVLAIVSNPEHTTDLHASEKPWHEEFPGPRPRKVY